MLHLYKSLVLCCCFILGMGGFNPTPLYALGGGGNGNSGSTKGGTDMPSTNFDKEDTVPKPKLKKSKLKFECDYLSNANYLGRTDPNASPTLSPIIKYTSTQKFYYQASFVGAADPNSFYFDEMDLGIGKVFKFSKQWDGSIGYSRYFFNSNAARIKAAIQGDLTADLGFDWDILETSIMGDWSSGNAAFKTKNKQKQVVQVNQQTDDYTFTFSNNHIFLFEDVLHKNNDLTVIPQLDVLAGTQNFLSNFRGNVKPPRPSKPVKPVKPTSPGKNASQQAINNYNAALNKYNIDEANYPTALATYDQEMLTYNSSQITYDKFNSQVSQFNLTAITFTLFVSYDIKNFSLGIAPYVTMPYNLPSSDLAAGQSNSPYFVMAASIYYTFKYIH